MILPFAAGRSTAAGSLQAGNEEASGYSMEAPREREGELNDLLYDSPVQTMTVMGPDGDYGGFWLLQFTTPPECREGPAAWMS